MPFSRFKLALALWCVAEAAVFVAAAHVVGLGWTMLAELATTALGFALLKRTGAAAMLKLRAAFQGRLAPGQSRGVDAIEGALAVLGALALVLPGFLSDLLGLALLAGVVRRRLATLIASGRFGRPGGVRVTVRRGGAAGRAEVLDLQPGEWRSGDTKLRP